MALNALTLSTTSGVQGRPFQATINGLTTGRVDVINDGSPGFGVVNGKVQNASLPYPVSTVVLREWEPGVGVGYRDTRIDIVAATRDVLRAQAIASLGAGRTLKRFRTAGDTLPDGSIAYKVYAEDDLGATIQTAAGTPTPTPTLTLTGPLTYATNSPSGTLVANIGNVPAGATPTLTPNDGRLVIAGNGTDGWTVRTGLSASTAGTIALSVSAPGANGATVNVTVTGGSVTGPGYDVFVLAGQSNMVGRYGPIDATLDATDPLIEMYGFDSQAVSLAANPLDHQDEGPNTIGMGLNFAKAYIGAGLLSSGRKILLVPCARGDTGFITGFWRAGGAGDAPAIARTNAAMAQGSGTNVLKAILWHQGERDRTQTKVQYEADLDTLVERWRSAMTGANSLTPFVCGGLMPGGGQTSGVITAALTETPTRINKSAFSASTSLTSGGDNIHFSATSLRTMGDRYFAAYQNAMTNTVAAKAPGQVPDLYATAVSGGQTKLEWLAPSSGGSPITDYLIEYKASSASTWTTSAHAASNSTSATITGLTNGTTYNTRVTAINAVGVGITSAVVDTGSTVNLLVSPQNFSGWTRTGVTVTNDVANEPSGGTLTADRITEDAVQNNHSLVSANTGGQVLSGKTYTFAFDVLYETLPYMQIHTLNNGFAADCWANFDIQNGAVGTNNGAGAINASVTDKGNGWKRCTVSFIAESDGFGQVAIRGAASAASGRSQTYVGSNRSAVLANAQMVRGPSAIFYP